MSSPLSGVESTRGSALGPDWANQLQLHGSAKLEDNPRVTFEYKVELAEILTTPPAGVSEATSYPLYVRLTNGKVIGSDIVINATGVEPSINFKLLQAPTGGDGCGVAGLRVDQEMRTCIDDIYAAGDVCDASRWDNSTLWYQVVLLGLYNAQGMAVESYRILLRCTPGMEYVKLVLTEGCVVGAVLIGETELEETIENLILNRLDVTHIEEHLLDPAIDIDDYFD